MATKSNTSQGKLVAASDGFKSQIYNYSQFQSTTQDLNPLENILHNRYAQYGPITPNEHLQLQHLVSLHVRQLRLQTDMTLLDEQPDHPSLYERHITRGELPYMRREAERLPIQIRQARIEMDRLLAQRPITAEPALRLTDPEPRPVEPDPHEPNSPATDEDLHKKTEFIPQHLRDFLYEHEIFGHFKKTEEPARTP